MLVFGLKIVVRGLHGFKSARDRFVVDRDRYHNALSTARTYVKADQAVPLEIRELLCGTIVSCCLDIVAATSGTRADDESQQKRMFGAILANLEHYELSSVWKDALNDVEGEAETKGVEWLSLASARRTGVGSVTPQQTEGNLSYGGDNVDDTQLGDA